MKGQLTLAVYIELARALQANTRWVKQDGFGEESLLTAVDLSRVFGLEKERVKRALKQLQAWGLIQPVGFEPKRYSFNAYGLKQALHQDHAEQEAILSELLEALA
jgi:Fic family protein